MAHRERRFKRIFVGIEKNRTEEFAGVKLDCGVDELFYFEIGIYPKRRRICVYLAREPLYF